MTTQIKITDVTGYDWIEVGEVYNVTERSSNGYYIKVFGTEFHVLQEDCELVGGATHDRLSAITNEC